MSDWFLAKDTRSSTTLLGISIGATNATPRVAPPGGSQPLLGMNPIAMAVPDGDGGVAFQFDFSTSAVALGKITMAAAAGEEIPLGWAVDADGQPTTDPQAALGGSLVSAGGYKGYGIGLMVEILASALTGSNRSVDVPPLKAPEGPPHNLGQFYIVIDPSAYSDQGFSDHLTALAASIAEDSEARLPGANRQTPESVDVSDDFEHPPPAWPGLDAQQSQHTKEHYEQRSRCSRFGSH